LTGCLSFYPAKSLGGIGDGGILVTNDREITEKVRLLRDHGQQRETGDVLFYGFNSRLDNLHAAILDVKLKYLPRWIERRREIASIYHQGLSDISQLQLPPPPQAEDRYFDVFQNYIIRTRKRDELVEHLTDNGIETLISWPIPMNHQKALGLSHFKLPETEAISREVLSLPLYPELSDEQVEYVIQTVRNSYLR
nr:DegT/DnrJ/EryC1/StrS family aminotransferase [Chloroflexota bacterium]